MAYDPNQPRDYRGRWTKAGGVTYRQNTSYFDIRNYEDESGIFIEIDELIPCLRDTATGELVETEVAIIPRKELKNYHSRNGWYLNWSKRPVDEVVFGVFLKDDLEPQGLISLRCEHGGVYIGFVCAAPQNNKQLLDGKTPKYTGLGGHLFAIAVEESAKAGSYGTVYGYASNEKLLKHYIDKLGATHYRVAHPYQFIIEGNASQHLIDAYNYRRR